MKLDYQKIHWGDSPSDVLDARVWDYDKCEAVGRCTAISYRASKRGKFQTWRHTFERRPRLLVSGGTDHVASARPTPKDAIAIGWVVDLELEGGRRVHAPGHLVVTDARGSSIWLAAIGTQPKIAIEQMARGPIVTPHGIEH